MAASIVCIFDVTLLGVLAASTLLNIHHGEHRLPNGTETLPDNFKADIVSESVFNIAGKRQILFGVFSETN